MAFYTEQHKFMWSAGVNTEIVIDYLRLCGKLKSPHNHGVTIYLGNEQIIHTRILQAHNNRLMWHINPEPYNEFPHILWIWIKRNKGMLLFQIHYFLIRQICPLGRNGVKWDILPGQGRCTLCSRSSSSSSSMQTNVAAVPNTWSSPPCMSMQQAGHWRNGAWGYEPCCIQQKTTHDSQERRKEYRFGHWLQVVQCMNKHNTRRNAGKTCDEVIFLALFI